MITETYDINELGKQTSLDHARRYLREVSSDFIELDEEALEDDLREVPEVVEDAEVLNSAESYLISYGESLGSDVASETEVVELYDLSDQVVVSGTGDYFHSTQEILESENPRGKASREIRGERLERGFRKIARKVGI